MDYWLYVLFLKTAIEINGIYQTVIKIGTTLYPINRKWASKTYGPNPPIYLHLFKFSSESFQNNPQNLYDLDNKKLPEFLITYGYGDMHIKNGGGTEWYNKNGWNYIEVLHKFLKYHNISIVEEFDSDPFPLIAPTISENKNLEGEDEQIISRKTLKENESLFKKFCRIFLPGKDPRRIQVELWNTFQEICKKPEHMSYRAIVQWPTGVGKTIATLMLIAISAERCKCRGEIYRGLFVSPKNDILNTISTDFNKLSEFGITIYDGAQGKLSSLTIPTNCHILISACQAALINDKGMRRLPHISHVHYDEVHRITGEQYFQLLKEMLEKWNTEFLTGTSATPKTCSSSQHAKLAELFGDPYNIIHKCDVEDAVKEGWIAKPRYIVNITSKNEDRTVELDAFAIAINNAIEQKKIAGHWKGGKVIAYSPDSSEDARYLLNNAAKYIPNAIFYSAIDGQRTDEAFIKAPLDGSIHILFACQRFREGSDVKGVDMTCALVGNTTAVYILLQMCGRALRLDYEGKEGWCLIVRPSDQGTTEDDVLASIILDIIEFLGDSRKKREVKEIEPLIKTFLGEVNVSGSSLSLEETIKRVQAAYVRRLYIRQKKAVESLTYKDLKTKVEGLGIMSRSEYSEKALINELPDTPSDIRGWISWYDLFRANSGVERMTLYDLQKFCKDNAISKKDDYILRTDCPSWDNLIDGFLTDLSSPMPSHLETELFKSGRGGRR